MSESVASHDVAVCARWNNIVSRVAKRVVDAIASYLLAASAIDARLTENRQHECLVDVAHKPSLSIHALVCTQHEKRTSLRGLAVTPLARKSFYALRIGEFRPSFLSAVASFFAISMASLALVREASRSGLVAKEKLCSEWKQLPASVALAFANRIERILVHAPMVHDGTQLGNAP